MPMLNNVVGYWAYIRRGGAYIRNDVSVSTCCGLIHGGLYLEVYGSMENFPGT